MKAQPSVEVMRSTRLSPYLIILNLFELRLRRSFGLTFDCLLLYEIKNKAGYMATPVACGWAGAVIEVSICIRYYIAFRSLSRSWFSDSPSKILRTSWKWKMENFWQFRSLIFLFRTQDHPVNIKQILYHVYSHIKGEGVTILAIGKKSKNTFGFLRPAEEFGFPFFSCVFWESCCFLRIERAYPLN